MQERKPKLRTFLPPETTSQTGRKKRRNAGLRETAKLWGGLWLAGFIAAGLAIVFTNNQNLWAEISLTFTLIWLCLGVWGGTLFILQRSISKWLHRPSSTSNSSDGRAHHASDQSDDVFLPDPQAIHSWADEIARSADAMCETHEKVPADTDPLGSLADRQTASLLGLLDKLNDLTGRVGNQDKR